MCLIEYMKLVNLQKESKYYYIDYTSAYLFRPHPHAVKEENPEFIKAWLEGTFTLRDWIQNVGFDFRKVESSAHLTNDVAEKLLENRKKHYNSLIEFKVQKILMERLKQSLSTPKYAIVFANEELADIEKLINGNLGQNEEGKLREYYRISKDTHLLRLKQKSEEPNYINPYDIHNAEKIIEYDWLSRYKEMPN